MINYIASINLIIKISFEKIQTFIREVEPYFWQGKCTFDLDEANKNELI